MSRLTADQVFTRVLRARAISDEDAIRLFGAFDPTDCDKCKFRELHNPEEGGHCYMFKEPPKNRCGQRGQS